MLIAGGLMLILRLFPVLLKVFLLVGMLTWLLLVLAGPAPDITCRFNKQEGTGSRRDFFVGCPSALGASSLLCY